MSIGDYVAVFKFKGVVMLEKYLVNNGFISCPEGGGEIAVCQSGLVHLFGKKFEGVKVFVIETSDTKKSGFKKCQYTKTVSGKVKYVEFGYREWYTDRIGRYNYRVRKAYRKIEPEVYESLTVSGRSTKDAKSIIEVLHFFWDMGEKCDFWIHARPL